jgi:hypothetical protein
MTESGTENGKWWAPDFAEAVEVDDALLVSELDDTVEVVVRDHL